MTLTRNIRSPWRWSEWWSKHFGAFLSVLIWTFWTNILLYKKCIGWCKKFSETKSVHCAVRTGYLNKTEVVCKKWVALHPTLILCIEEVLNSFFIWEMERLEFIRFWFFNHAYGLAWNCGNLRFTQCSLTCVYVCVFSTFRRKMHKRSATLNDGSTFNVNFVTGLLLYSFELIIIP